MFEYSCKLSLWAKHPTDDLTDLPHRLGLQPHRCWKAGDVRSTPDGKPLSGNYRESYCSMRIQEERSVSLPDLLKKTLNEFKKHKDVFEEYASKGVSFSFFAAWFSDGINSRDVFDWKILAEMAELKIGLDLDFYGPEDISKDGGV